MKTTLEAAVQQARFNLRLLLLGATATLAALPCAAALRTIERRVTTEEFAYLVRAFVRWTFLIELVKQPKIETTKFEVRWAERLSQDDPRHATYEQCLEAFFALVVEFAASLDRQERGEVWRQFIETQLLPYELPVDYRQRLITAPIHRAANIQWLWDSEEVRKAIHLRRAVTDAATVGDQAQVFALALGSKIKVKTYLTDRVLTGAHKTNREKRWEVHPASVHFATRLECLQIERELLGQLCFFRGFPAETRAQLLEAGLLVTRPESTCPVTLKPLEYAAFVAEIGERVHGKSDFQVAHLNPLKADPGDAASGHTAANIAWISGDGNRIQGSYSLEQTRALLKEVAERYHATGWRNPTETP